MSIFCGAVQGWLKYLFFRLLKWCVSSWKDLGWKIPGVASKEERSWAENPPSEKEMGVCLKSKVAFDLVGHLREEGVKLAGLTLGEWSDISLISTAVTMQGSLWSCWCQRSPTSP